MTAFWKEERKRSSAETIRGFEAILGGECDDIPEQAFLFCGSIDDVLRKRDALQ